MKVLLPSCVNVISVKKGIQFNSSHVPPRVHSHGTQWLSYSWEKRVSLLFSTLTKPYLWEGGAWRGWLVVPVWWRWVCRIGGFSMGPVNKTINCQFLSKTFGTQPNYKKKMSLTLVVQLMYACRFKYLRYLYFTWVQLLYIFREKYFDSTALFYFLN